jgi:SAM-dependent methyltransferase
MSGTFNVNEYWLKRGRHYIGERFPAEYHSLQEQFLLKTLQRSGVSFQSIVDLGCGYGRITRLLADQFPNAKITAVDLSEEQLNNAREYCAGRTNIEFATYDFYSSAPLPGGHHDLLVAIEVFLHHPGTFLQPFLQRIASAARYVVNIDWSEEWPWPRPEHVWIHDYSVLYREVGMESIALPIPERVEGLQQRLFFAGRILPESIRALQEHTSTAAQTPPPAMVGWYVQLEHAIGDLLLFVPEQATLILVNDNQWGTAETDLHPRRVRPFLEHGGQFWGAPADSATAIRELTRMQSSGATHIAFAWHSFWWLDHYSDFSRYLHTEGKCLLDNDRIRIFELPR